MVNTAQISLLSICWFLFVRKCMHTSPLRTWSFFYSEFSATINAEFLREILPPHGRNSHERFMDPNVHRVFNGFLRVVRASVVNWRSIVCRSLIHTHTVATFKMHSNTLMFWPCLLEYILKISSRWCSKAAIISWLLDHKKVILEYHYVWFRRFSLSIPSSHIAQPWWITLRLGPCDF